VTGSDDGTKRTLGEAASNIDVLLGKLQQGTLAYELVTLLKTTPRERWAEALDEFLKLRITQKVEGTAHAEDQTTRD
jgi:hypothetical protein